jgi:membrane protease YdiL (CAAX protease family)
MSYFALAFGLSWGLQAGLASQDILLTAASAAAVPWLMLITFAPALAAFIVVRLDPERTSREALARRVRTWRVPVRWYVAGAAVAAAAALIGGSMYALLGGSVTPQFAALALIPIALLGAFGEEVGWRGLALPGLLDQVAAMRASIVLGTLWGIWHVPGQLLDPSIANLTLVAVTVTQTIGLSILLTWVILRTRGSILAAAVLHASWNITGIALAITSVEGRALMAFAVLLAGFVVALVGSLTTRHAAEPRLSTVT